MTPVLSSQHLMLGQATAEHLNLHTVPSAVYAGTAKSTFCGINTTWQTQHLPHKPLMMETVSKRIVKPIMTKLIAQQDFTIYNYHESFKSYNTSMHVKVTVFWVVVRVVC
jgi:hypothetical protein